MLIYKEMAKQTIVPLVLMLLLYFIKSNISDALNLNPTVLSLLLITTETKKIYSAQTGGAQPHIQPKDLEPILIKIPIDLKEQNAIANILSDIDLEISKLV